MTRRKRENNGRYADEYRCDACGGPAGFETYHTDDEVCLATDGPGFLLCGKTACPGFKGTIEERRALYTAQRAKNKAAE